MADEPTRPREPGRSALAGPRLFVIGAGQVTTVELVPGRELTIGRHSGADITIDDPELSRVHARVRLQGLLQVLDAESSNGTLVRGRAIAPNTWITVGPGELVELGGTLLVLEASLASEATAPTGISAMAAVQRVADKVADSSISVLLLGETGVGKGVLARRIHERSPRAGARFLELNCAALPETLLESELLGHERGAFTGATTAKPGLLEIADGGTVFLDEIGELPAPLQAKLLRVIEERQVLRLGGSTPRTTDVRFVAATNRDLAVEVARGSFRRDLYYRLDGITLHVPPLRERRDEIEPLAQRFLAEAAAQRGVPVPSLSSAVRTFLLGHAWPGNVRELRNLIGRAVILCDGDRVEIEHLFVPLPGPPREGPPPPIEGASASEEDPERRRILDALDRFAGNQTRAAAALGMSRTTLSARLDALGIPRPRKHR